MLINEAALTNMTSAANIKRSRNTRRGKRGKINARKGRTSKRKTNRGNNRNNNNKYKNKVSRYKSKISKYKNKARRYKDMLNEDEDMSYVSYIPSDNAFSTFPYFPPTPIVPSTPAIPPVLTSSYTPTTSISLPTPDNHKTSIKKKANQMEKDIISQREIVHNVVDATVMVFNIIPKYSKIIFSELMVHVCKIILEEHKNDSHEALKQNMRNYINKIKILGDEFIMTSLDFLKNENVGILNCFITMKDKLETSKKKIDHDDMIDGEYNYDNAILGITIRHTDIDIKTELRKIQTSKEEMINKIIDNINQIIGSAISHDYDSNSMNTLRKALNDTETYTTLYGTPEEIKSHIFKGITNSYNNANRKTMKGRIKLEIEESKINSSIKKIFTQYSSNSHDEDVHEILKNEMNRIVPAYKQVINNFTQGMDKIMKESKTKAKYLDLLAIKNNHTKQKPNLPLKNEINPIAIEDHSLDSEKSNGQKIIVEEPNENPYHISL
ncbi:MAG: hypothetical protein LBH49_01835 [Puniceicoccales bacterium]|jgi:uncharacterized protein (UPF0335 family)|nr:hypothetical protein [Puniceicoccales bacterium]